MSDEIEAILNDIGWQFAKRCNQSLIFWNWEPRKNGGLLFAGKPDAREGLEYLKKIKRAMADLPAPLREMLGNEMRTSEDWDSGRDLLSELETALFRTTNYAQTERDRLWSGRGPSANHSSREVAEKMAEIYVLGLGKMPTYGRKPDSSEPSTDYSRAVRDVFGKIQLLAHFGEPCKQAIEMLKENDSAKYNALLTKRSLKGRKPPSLMHNSN